MAEDARTGTSSPTAERGIHLALGAAIAGTAAALDPILGIPPAWGPAQTGGVVLGAGVALAGLVLPAGLRSVSTRLALAALSVGVLVALGELGLRAIGHDFARQEQAHLAIPPYFRESTEPLGEVYFKRPGPQTWVGQVLNVRLDQIGVEPNPFADEPELTIRYDSGGFRNEGELEDWDLAVVGDSFTELGYLPHEDLFTTLLARQLGIRVKNLGVSETGNLSHLSYYRHFGDAPSVKDVVLVFFEGNDPLETAMEHRNLRVFERGGPRPVREFERQPSLLRHLYGMLQAPEVKKVHRLDQAIFAGEGEGAGEPLSLFFTPQPLSWVSEQLVAHYERVEPDFAPEHHADADAEAALSLAFSGFAQLAAERGVRPWLAYMPCKARVHHGQLEFTERASEKLRTWEPSELPEAIRTLAEAHGLRFIDLTPALVAEARASGSLLYNTMYDCHLNRRGSHLVAEALVEALGGHLGGGPLED